MYAVGVDLAWSPRNSTGLAIAERVRGRWILREAITGLRSNEDILTYIEAGVGDAPAILAIDAPLVVPNERKGRDGDRLITRLFGRFEAGVYPATRFYLGRYGGSRVWDLVEDLKRAGFRHDCRLEPRRPTRLFFETYPHAAAVALFGLPKTLKYKAREGRTYETRWRAFRELESLLGSLSRFSPAMAGADEAFEPDVRCLRGRRLKEYDDLLDGILCAYIAAYYWTWGTRKCAIVGSLEGGYIVTPMTPAIARRAPVASPIFAYDGGQ